MRKEGRKKRPSKYEEPIHIEATPEEIAQTVFAGKPKPKDQWEYLKGEADKGE